MGVYEPPHLRRLGLSRLQEKHEFQAPVLSDEVQKRLTTLRIICDLRVEILGGTQKGGFQKGGFWRMFPRNENRNDGTFRCSPGTKHRNEGTFACSPATKTGTRVHSPKPPFYETALLSPSEIPIKNCNSSHVSGPPFQHLTQSLYIIWKTIL